MRSAALRLGATAVLAGAVLAGQAAATTGDPQPDTAAVRQATVAFRDPAAAHAAGYGETPLTDIHGNSCIVDLSDAAAGGMGIHLVNGGLVGDAELDPLRPEAVMYDPGPNGSMKLVAVEYVVFQDVWDAAHGGTATDHADAPQLFGQTLNLNNGSRYGLPPFWELHLWLWKHNSAPDTLAGVDGLYQDWNPRVTC